MTFVDILIIFFVLVFVALLFKGIVGTFKRSIVGAILCIVFLFPVWVIWVVVEMFLGGE